MGRHGCGPSPYAKKSDRQTVVRLYVGDIGHQGITFRVFQKSRDSERLCDGEKIPGFEIGEEGKQGWIVAARLGSSAANHRRRSGCQASLHPDHIFFCTMTGCMLQMLAGPGAKVSKHESTTARACRSLPPTPVTPNGALTCTG